MRLIDADALKKSIPTTKVDIFENCRYCSLLDDEQIKKIIDDVPSVDAVPVKHGRWEYIGGYGYKHRCSECFMCAERISKYCPNCGARMDGEENE